MIISTSPSLCNTDTPAGCTGSGRPGPWPLGRWGAGDRGAGALGHLVPGGAAPRLDSPFLFSIIF